MKNRRTIVAAALATGTASLIAPLNAIAQSKPLTIIVPYPPGGSVDVMARILAERLKTTLGRTVIVENKSGAGGRIGLAWLKGQQRDGSTVLLGSSGLVINSIVFEDSSAYNFKRDFVGVAQVGRAPMALAVPFGSAANSIQEFVKSGKDNQFTYGTNGPGSFGHLVGLKFAKAVNLQANPVSYQGGAPMANDLMAGQIESAIDAQADFVERHRAKKIKVLASFGKERSTLLPDVPTMAEQGVPGIAGELWFGFLAGRGESTAFLADLQQGVRKALEDDVAKEKLSKLMSVEFKESAGLSDLIAMDFETWTPVIDEVGLRNKK
ncbi:Bug family tripartite tricarboxylate transporter substrate binding protein [Pseudorhodoferax soli]|uniref:Tripartite-type tricarboxylate transporter receptor subunit TctC n=1 Tax=Pseudorhodoferax soli TaxID=545864 RepID=A0A368XKU8_9BURK|nr:tripartite tricarboxylate transporter substrate binding protein [Pseudorhodoferax soli]RCW68651.1 tripartite-type tricarboxylate transporter receptor subunit TctC [Pseudorhodoferax soli]